MIKKIAIPLENGLLCPHFGHCRTFAVLNIENDVIVDAKEVNPPEHVPGLYPRWIAQFGVTDVIAGGMGQHAIDLFMEQKINVFVGAPIKSARDLVNDFIAGKLSLNANYCNHDGDHSNCSH